MEMVSNQSGGLSAFKIEMYHQDLEAWKGEISPQIKRPGGTLPNDFDLQIRDSLVARALKDNPRLVPIVCARYSAEAETVPGNAKPTKVGILVDTGNLVVTGHISHSTIWFVDEKMNTLQTMVRLLVEGKNGKQVIDVYSFPANPGFSKVGSGANAAYSANVDQTESSRDLNLLEYVEANQMNVLGWIPITEIQDQKIPTY